MSRITYLPILIILFQCLHVGISQTDYSSLQFNHTDSVRGLLDDQRAAFDVYYYDLEVKIDIEQKSIFGNNDIYFKVLDTLKQIQIDLFDQYQVTTVLLDNAPIHFTRNSNAIFIQPNQPLTAGKHLVSIEYHGPLPIAKMAPWDGGFVFDKSANGLPWVGVACEGFGASSWWPLKDHLSDEPDSMSISIHTPGNLVAVSNGNLLKTITHRDGHKEYKWHVSYSINSYNVTVNIGDYVHFDDVYTSPTGDQLALDYYVLSENLEQAKKHFKQASGVLEVYEHYFGKYPFWNDGFALVQTPYLGMEHQGAIAYGNQFKRGYLGMLSPAYLDFDYIIVHETGHEYWGNSVSVGDHAEMWIHEGFTTYMEALYVEYVYGYNAALEYLDGQKVRIGNRCPILGPMSVNFNGFCSADMYYKGAWFLHTLRTCVGDDAQWWSLLKDLYLHFQKSIVTTEDILVFMENYTSLSLKPVFEQYLQHAALPIIEHKWEVSGDTTYLSARWLTDVENFAMPVWINEIAVRPIRKQITNNWQVIFSCPVLGQPKGPVFETRLGLYEIKSVD